MKTTFAALLLSSISLLTPATAFSFETESVIAKFDDLNSTSSGARPLEKHPEVGIYKGMHWIGFSVDTPPNPMNVAFDAWDFVGVPPTSEPNYISAPGVPDFFLPSMSSNYRGSEVVFFDLRSFYWGCGTPSNLVQPAKSVPVPGWCSLNIYGYSHGSRLPTAKATSFYFAKETVDTLELVFAGLPTSFRAIDRVEFLLEGDRPQPTLFIDNVSYSTYNVTDMGTGLGEVIHQQSAVTGTKSRHGGLAPQRVDDSL